MIVVSVIALVFNLILFKILHSGDGHYHLGGGDCGHHHHHDHNETKNAEKGQSADTPKFNGNDEKSSASGEKENDDKKSKDKEKPIIKNKEVRSNINLDSALLHVIGDLLSSIGVVVIAVIIYFYPEAWYCDPIITYFFALIVLVTTIPLIKQCIIILMEGTPEKLNTKELVADIWALNKIDLEDEENILDVHDLHVWSISVGKLAMTVHLKARRPLKALADVNHMCR